MGDVFNPFGSEGTKKVYDPVATAKARAIADLAARQKFVKDYSQIFGGPFGTENYRDSLSTYFGGTPFDQIARNLANHNVFKSTVKKYREVPDIDDGGFLGNMWKFDPMSPGGHKTFFYDYNPTNPDSPLQKGLLKQKDQMEQIMRTSYLQNAAMNDKNAPGKSLF